MMQRIMQVACDFWTGFKEVVMSELFGSSPFVRGAYWFRGQGGSSMKLESSFDRWYSRVKCGRDRFAVAKELLDDFRKQAACFPEYEAIKGEEARVLGLAQHFGLPTRQLDWSESPYVAAFFALSGRDISNAGSDDVAIWALNTASEFWGKERGVELDLTDSSGNIRLKSQIGHFTILRTPAACLEDYLASFPAGQVCAKPALFKFVIPAAVNREALADLDCMGINHATLFNGLEGCALSAKMRKELAL